MLARSLNEFIRLQANEEDSFLRHAVDSLEAWQGMDPTSTLDAFAVRFGELAIDDEVPFTFELPNDARPWPAPQFGRFPLHEKLLHRQQKSSSRKQRRRDDPEHIKRRRRTSCKKGSARIAREKTKPITLRPSHQPPSSSPCFLDLPAEVRNQIYHLVTVKDTLIHPALRCVFPIKNGRLLKKKHVRRYPLEPALATVNHQVRRDSLSIFYGFNRFVLVKNSCHMFTHRSMTNPTTLQKWMPRDGLARFLKHVDVHFSALSPVTGVSTWISYNLRRLDDTFTVDLTTLEMASGKPALKRSSEPKKVEFSSLCSCSESDALPKLHAAFRANECGRNLVEVAVFVIQKRLEHLFGAADGIKTPTYQPGDRLCKRCEKQTFEAVHVGL